LDGWQDTRPKDALAFGTLWHWFLEQNYGAIINGAKKPIDFRVLEQKYLDATLGRNSNPEAMERYMAMASALYDVYWLHWKQDFRRKWEGAECQFDVNWNTFRLRGMRDGLYRFKKQTWLLETKTTGRIDEYTLTDALAFNFQNLFYIVASEEELGKPIAGVMYNVVCKPQLRQGKAESLVNFAKRMRDDVSFRPRRYFVRFECTYPEVVKQRFREELANKLTDFWEWVDGKLATYRNEQACICRWTCEFLAACANNDLAGYVRTRELFGELGGR